MKKGWVIFLLALSLAFFTISIAPASTEEKDETEQEKYYQYGHDDEARNTKLFEEAEKRWKSKRRHSHTLDDAKKSAQEGRGNSPRYLLRDATREEQIKKHQEEVLNDE